MSNTAWKDRPPKDKTGLKCPACGGEKLSVAKTTPGDGMRHRRYECVACKQPFMTVELLATTFTRLVDAVQKKAESGGTGAASAALDACAAQEETK